MKKLATVGLTIVAGAALVWPLTAMAQSSQQPQVFITSGGAPASDLAMDDYQAFDQFSQEHPAIIQELARNPRLVSSAGFASRHPEWRDFLDAHGDLRTAIAEDPGNFLPLTASGEGRWKHPSWHRGRAGHRGASGAAANSAEGTAKGSTSVAAADSGAAADSAGAPNAPAGSAAAGAPAAGAAAGAPAAGGANGNGGAQ
ncbi:MAG TPA: hypothetical protein VFB15_00370 [Candidatus Binataceae bacterium]|jgi:hypothetical protein|nr:hypothetical protein [Candidatus Binataceae bacterium]